MALALAGALARKHRNVLFLSTESLQSAAMLLPEEEEPTAEFRDALLSGGPKMADILPGQCGSAGFDYLKPFSQPIASYGLTVRHFQRLAELLKEAGRYDCVVLDCSPEFTEEKTRLMGVCDRVVIVTGQGQAAEWKTRALLKDIIIPDGENSKKYLAVCNRYSADRSDSIRTVLLGRLRILAEIPELPGEACSSLERLSEEEGIAKLALHIL